MLSFFNKPYPFNDDVKYNARIILFISLGILVFLLVFQPVDISSFSRKKILFLVTGYAVSTFLTLTINLIVLPSLWPKFFESSKWNIKREIFWNIWVILAISGCYFLFYTRLFGIINIRLMDVIKIILLAVIPVAALITINYNRLLRTHLKSARLMSRKLIESKQQQQKMVYFESEYKKDHFRIQSGAIILIRAADNYIEVYYESDGAVRKQMIRNSLKNIETLLGEFDFIVQCHRSFMVNINHIKEIQGNPLGYKLFFEGIDFPAIVSQKYIDDFRKVI
ncbi:MAG: LytTR family transcriptional regulator [Bacteroidetes bacterium]|nr:LytTR family transcriptional regulator [Bacteroidota bacterium]